MPASSGYLILAILLFTFALIFTKGKARRLFESLLLICCTASSVMFFSHALQGEGKPAAIQSQAELQRSDSNLKFMSIVNVGVAKFYDQFFPVKDAKGKKHNLMEERNSGLNKLVKASKTAMQDCIKNSPDNTSCKAKLVVLLSNLGSSRVKQDIELQKNTCASLRESKGEAERLLGDALWHAYISPEPETANLEKDLDAIVTRIQRGWFQDNAKFALYKSCAQPKEFDRLSNQLQQRYVTSFQMGLTILLFGLLATFIGVVVIIIQLGSLGRKESKSEISSDNIKSESVELKISLRATYGIFVGWISSEVAIGQGLKLLPKGIFSLSQDPLGMATFSLVSYVITMIPAFLLIYFIAIRPNGLNPLDALCLRWKTRSFGPFKLLFAGILGWCSIIPLVMLGALIASSFLGSQGSDNPILAQIAQVVSSKNYLAIFILLFTVAAVAPICEEIIFRGFLYSALKSRIGIFPALLISSIIFAGIHMDKGGAVMLMALGPVLALLLERTRSLFPSMLAHGLWNGGAFALSIALYLN